MSSIASGMAAKSAAGPIKPLTNTGYFAASEKPLTSLVFLLPLIVIYELGKAYLGPAEHQIVAFTLLVRFFAYLGTTAKYLPAATVVCVLLGVHLLRRDSWQVDVRYLGWMFVESVLLAIPLIGVGVLASRYLPLWAFSRPPRLADMILLSVGAGIYEELIFRFIAIALLSLIFVDWLKFSEVWAAVWIVLITSIGFALYHYLGNELFQTQTFVFRTLAGCYFAAIFLYRGFGVTAGSHAAYDILVVLCAGLR